MYDMRTMMNAGFTWQRAALAYGEMLMTAGQVIQKRSLQMAMGTMKPEEAVRMVLEKQSAFAKSVEMAARSSAAGRGHAATTLAAIKPIGSKIRANARRLR